MDVSSGLHRVEFTEEWLEEPIEVESHGVSANLTSFLGPVTIDGLDGKGKDDRCWTRF